MDGEPSPVRMGDFIAHKFFDRESLNSKSQFCPEDVNQIEWRVFLTDLLNQMLVDTSVIDFEQNWSIWVKSFKNFFVKNICRLQLLEKCNITVVDSCRAPSGMAKEQVKSTFKASTLVESIRISTIHGIKGETIDAALLVSSPTKASEGGHWSQWLKDNMNDAEYCRFAYVASSRPRHLLAWAVPWKKGENFEGLRTMGFVIKDNWI